MFMNVSGKVSIAPVLANLFMALLLLLFQPFLFSCIVHYFALLYICIQESSAEAGPQDQAVVPAGVPKWETLLRLLYMHYYFHRMYSLVQETAQRYISSAHQLRLN